METEQATGTRQAGAVPGPRPGALTPYEGFHEMPIGGYWRAGGSSSEGSDRDPYTGEELVRIQLANAEDVDDAFQAAARAQHVWAATPAQVRRNVFLRAAHLCEQRREEIVTWLIKESGSTRRKAHFEWQLFHEGLFEAASLPLHVEGRLLPATVPGKESHVFRRPVGVVAVISPWSFPLHLSNRSVAPALALGNAVVLKPASDTPVTGGLLLAKLFEEAGLPLETLSVVVGAGQEIGDLFVDHAIPRVISFTGSTEIGRRIGENAGRNVKRVCLELSGNAPFVVLDDADLDRAVEAAVAGKFLHQGQLCLAINRHLIDGHLYDEFLRRFVDRVATLKVGDPSDPDTAIGPLINQPQLDRILQIVDETVDRGARVLQREGPQGLVLPPIILADVTNDMPSARQEIFGPVASLLRFDDEEEAIRLANDSEHGLSSAVFTRDVGRGLRVARRIEAGMTHVNDWPVNDEANTAFGGEKASGLGRFGGAWAVAELTTDHWVSVQERTRKYPI